MSRRTRTNANTNTNTNTDKIPKPIFGIEIEIFVKVKRNVEYDVLEYRAQRARLPAHWQQWDFDLSNAQAQSIQQMTKQAIQRNYVKAALSALISQSLGNNSGWKVVSDASLTEWKLSVPPDARRWCQSPPSQFHAVSSSARG